MSRVGKHPVQLPAGVTATLADGKVVVKGKLGELSMDIHEAVKVTLEDNAFVVVPADKNNKQGRMLWGTTRANLNNMVIGVSEGFTRKLEMIGVGYKAQATAKGIKLSLGYSHDIDYDAPAGIKITCPSATEIEIHGADKRLVGAVASDLRSYREPEPYKGKGVKEVEETIIRKEGKKK